MEQNCAGARRMAGVAILCVSVAGCSVTDYEHPVKTLGTALTASVDTVARLDEQMTAARNARWRNMVLSREAALLEADGACTTESAGCALEIVTRAGEAHPYPAVSVMPKARVGLDGLRSYSDSLMKIVEADTAGKVGTSVNAVLVSLADIEADIAKARGETPSNGTVATYGTAAGTAVTWLVGQYVDHVKVKALARATHDAQPVIDALADYHAAIGGAVAVHEIGAMQTDFIARQARFDEAQDNDRLTSEVFDNYVADAEAFDRILKGGAAEPLAAFAETHRTLKEHLNGEGNVTLADAVAAITRFRDKAKDFMGVLDAVREARTAASGGRDGDD